MNLLRLYHTIRYLKPHQVAAQISNRLRLKYENPSVYSTRPVPHFPGCVWKPLSDFLPPGKQQNRAVNILQGQMTFINQANSIGWMPAWERKDLPKLWLYNLHYFEWLWAFDKLGEEKYFANAKAVVQDWISRYTLSRGQHGWEPYPVSLRLMNWCAFFFGAHNSQTQDDAAFKEQIWTSLYMQAEWLTNHLEYHLLGNHLLENAAALALLGACFDGNAAKRWRGIGLQLLQEQTREQILSDGLHFERSAMYHSRMVYLFLLLHNTGNAQIQGVVSPLLQKMFRALASVCHPDRQIALLNDSALGIYNEPVALFNYADAMRCNQLNGEDAPRGSWALPVTGYYGYYEDNGTYIVCDAGPIGPDYIPGHAHADTFSFELSLRGSRVIVDSGVYNYEVSAKRSFCRSTKAHNTVEIEGQDQSEMWDAFRVARRAYPHDVNWAAQPDGFHLSGWHDGYMRLAGKPMHYRTFHYRSGGHLMVADRVVSNRSVECRSILHLHPDCSGAVVENNTVTVMYPAGCFRISYTGNGRLECHDGIYCPEFNKQWKNQVLVFSWKSSESPEVKFVIEPEL